MLGVPLYCQEHGNWCRAASAQMVLKYSKGTQYTQCGIVNYAFGLNYACGNGTFYWNSNANQGNWNDCVDDTMNACRGGTRFYQQNGSISYSALQPRINAGKPFVMSWRWSSGGAHDVVVKGFSGDYVYSNDPWDGSCTRTCASTVSASDRRWEDSIFQY